VKSGILNLVVLDAVKTEAWTATLMLRSWVVDTMVAVIHSFVNGTNCSEYLVAEETGVVCGCN
jgi:hypothetical protein